MADQGTEGFLSPFLRSQRTNAVVSLLKGKVLDVGCGSGALAAHVAPENYLGIDIDPISIAAAREKFPNHRFEQAQTTSENDFQTVVALAVIEHVPSPALFLQTLIDNLEGQNTDCRILCTTPHPAFETIYSIGVKFGLFSSSAHDEHETLLNQKTLAEAGGKAGLVLESYQRFLFGANQLAVYKTQTE